MYVTYLRLCVTFSAKHLQHKEPPKKVTVKFRDLHPTLFDAEMKDNRKRKANPSDKDGFGEGADELEADFDDSWLDESLQEVEVEEGFQRCNGRVLAGSEVADLSSSHLLDLLSDKPIIESGMPLQREVAPPQTGERSLRWEFTLP